MELNAKPDDLELDDDIPAGEEEEEKPDLDARVAQYGCLWPIQGEDLIRQQMRAGHQYMNNLIFIERCRRTCYRDLRREHANITEIEDLCQTLAHELDELRDQIKGARKAARSRVETKELNAKAAEVLKRLQPARKELKAARTAAAQNEVLKAAVKELDARVLLCQKFLRKQTDCFWGSYILVEASMKQVKKSKIDPYFRRWKGEGRIGVQIQHGMTVQRALDGVDRRLRIMPAPTSFLGENKSASHARHKARHLLYIRVDSEGRYPVWAVFPMIMHRDMPPDALIKGVTVHCRKRGLRDKWSCDITFTKPAVKPAKKPGVVAIDLGWRKRPDASLRVAYWVGSDGQDGEIRMPERVSRRLRHSDGLREVQDLSFNRMKSRLKLWLNAVDARDETLDKPMVPDFLTAIQPHMDKLRSHERIRKLVKQWEHERFEGDEHIFWAVKQWFRSSIHLYPWEVSQRKSTLRYRREMYRLAALELSKRYGTLVLENFDLSKAKRKNAPEQGPDAPKAQRTQLHASAPGEFRQALVQVFLREGGEVFRVDAMGTTSSCHACGATCKWDQAEEISHRCEHCGTLWDQDYNAAKNLLLRYALPQAS